ncbi:hypothetical protein [Bacillus thuringiensis]|uniref:hypothetical protein n=1 Tax=Bacillus thuringiensis TaxID=1428 RepID=UPI003B9867CD
MRELDDTLQAWINEDPSIENLEDTMNEVDALNSPTYEYQKRAGWKYSNGNAYYLEKNGGAITGWLYDKRKNRWYYFSPEPIPNVCCKAQMIQNHFLLIKIYQGPQKLFHFDENGVCTNP